jgi:hypothetical protein
MPSTVCRRGAFPPHMDCFKFGKYTAYILFYGLATYIILHSMSSALAQGGGRMCVAPGAFDAFAKGGATAEQDEAHARELELNPHPPVSEAVRFIQVDELPPVKVTSSEGNQVANLNIAAKHRIKISKRSDMKERVQAFSFSFHEKRSNILCLWYETFYGSWILQPQKGNLCPCKH